MRNTIRNFFLVLAHMPIEYPVHLFVGISAEVEGLADKPGSLITEKRELLFPFGHALYEFIEFRCEQDDVVIPLGGCFPYGSHFDSCVPVKSFSGRFRLFFFIDVFWG